jgi:hypothetical protein
MAASKEAISFDDIIQAGEHYDREAHLLHKAK